MKDADALLEDVAARLRAIPWGQAPIDRVIERLVQEGKLKKAAVHSFTIFEVRRRVLRAWWQARFVTAEQRRRERSHTIAASRAYRERLSGLRAVLIQLRRWDHHSYGSPLDQLAALGDSAAAELVYDLRANLIAAQRGARRVSRAARRVSKVLAAKQREYETRGRSKSVPIAFAKALAPVWHELTDTPPTVTHNVFDEIWVGPFVDFIEAAAATVDLPELSGNFPVAADKAAQWYGRRLRRQKRAAAPQK